MHIYEKFALKYLDKGYGTIPDKYGSKLPAVKEWNKGIIDKNRVLEWINGVVSSNIALLTGSVNKIIALDFDCIDEKLIKIIEPLLPPSPVERIGAKGFVRFFQYTGEQNYCLKHNGNVVLEILSNNKKVTIPPSRHPSGIDYKWTDKGLLDVNVEELPKLPPFLLSHIESKLRLEAPESTIKGNKLVNGRNDALSSLCGKLIQELIPLDDALKQLIAFDEESNDPPLFSDLKENYHTEKFTNALQFYSNHLSTINSRRFKNNEKYEVPITKNTVDQTLIDELRGKQRPLQENLESSKNLESLEGLNIKLPKLTGILKDIYDTILNNSYIKQEAFAFSASLVLLSTLVGRKLIFRNSASNLYILNVGKSGSGKNISQEILKSIFVDIHAEHLLGGGDYVSDASLTDSLPLSPVRLDIIDEASTLLKTASFGGAEYNKKIAEILCQLYTSSNSMFLGRSVADGRKGSVARPNVNLFCSTTPAGVQESVTPKSIDKGLLGRFLVFMGEDNKKASEVKYSYKLPTETLLKLKFWAGYEPPTSENKVGDMSQAMYEVKCSKMAGKMLTMAFKKLDELRQVNASKNSSILPVVARLYQQLLKICLIHSVSDTNCNMPIVKASSVDFAYKFILYYYAVMDRFITDNIVKTKRERDIKNIIKVIKNYGAITERQLFKEFMHIETKQWSLILKDLINFGIVQVLSKESSMYYTLTKENV